MQKSYGIYDGLKIPAKAYKCCLVHLIKSKEDKYPESLSKASSKEDDSQKKIELSLLNRWIFQPTRSSY